MVWCSCDLSFPQVSSLSLLAAHGMDFNRWIREGIPSSKVFHGVARCLVGLSLLTDSLS